jgi:nucleotide-binding universal stress UspA family protein
MEAVAVLAKLTVGSKVLAPDRLLAIDSRQGEVMRIYLVIIDESQEARIALRFASRRAAKTGGNVHLLALIPPQEFSALGSVQATIEEEAKDRAEALVMAAASNIFFESGKMPVIAVKQGEAVKVVREYLSEHPEVAALVLSAAKEGGPGPLVSHFTGAIAGQLSCPVFVVPGSLSDEDIDRLS